MQRPCLDLTERVLAAAGKDVRNGSVPCNDNSVRVDEGNSELHRQLLPDGRFSDRHGPDQDDGPPCGPGFAAVGHLLADRVQGRRNVVQVALDVPFRFGH